MVAAGHHELGAQQAAHGPAGQQHGHREVEGASNRQLRAAAPGEDDADGHGQEKTAEGGQATLPDGEDVAGMLGVGAQVRQHVHIGNETSHLMVGNEINPAVYIPGTWTGAGSCGALTIAPGANGTACSGTGNTQARRFLSLINQTQGKYFSATDFGFNGISANYEGVLASIEHRLADNYTILVNYTYGRCHSVVPVTSLGGPTIENPANPRGDYGPCSYDAPNVFNASVVYFSHATLGNRVASFLLSDWQIAPLMRFQTGSPVNPVDGTDRSLTGVSLTGPT